MAVRTFYVELWKKGTQPTGNAVLRYILRQIYKICTARCPQICKQKKNETSQIIKPFTNHKDKHLCMCSYNEYYSVQIKDYKYAKK